MFGKMPYRVFIVHPLTDPVVHKETRIVCTFIIYYSSRKSVKYLALIWSYRKEKSIVNDSIIQLTGRLLSEAYRVVIQFAILLFQETLELALTIKDKIGLL